eukprot:6128754-Alexandrium_andersonii.AAC.1
MLVMPGNGRYIDASPCSLFFATSALCQSVERFEAPPKSAMSKQFGLGLPAGRLPTGTEPSAGKSDQTGLVKSSLPIGAPIGRQRRDGEGFETPLEFTGHLPL